MPITDLKIKFTEIELKETAQSLLKHFSHAKIFLFNGEMGSGKTTLIKEMCRQLGSKDNFSSPTFSLINEYSCERGPLYHMDLYRIKDERELSDLGLEEYLDSNNYCFIEWPELSMTKIRQPYVKIDLKAGDKFHYLCAGCFL